MISYLNNELLNTNRQMNDLEHKRQKLLSTLDELVS